MQAAAVGLDPVAQPREPRAAARRRATRPVVGDANDEVPVVAHGIDLHERGATPAGLSLVEGRRLVENAITDFARFRVSLWKASALPAREGSFA